MSVFPLGAPKSQIFILFVFLFTLGPSACGGGGGGGGGFANSNSDSVAADEAGTMVPDTATSDASTNVNSSTRSDSGNARLAFSVPSKANISEIRAAVSVAAGSNADRGNGSFSVHRSQRPHSITQSSDQAGDEVHFEWLYTEGRPQPWASFYPNRSTGGLVELEGYSASNITARETQSVNDQVWTDISFYRQYGGEIVWDYLDRKTAQGAGEVWVYVQTDADGDGDGVPGELGDYDDSDYLAGGVWLYVPETVDPCISSRPCNVHQAGAFANGNDRFDGSDMDTLVGGATYEGRAIGVHTDPTRTVYFEAKARLTADFGSNTEFGYLQGEIFNFTSRSGASFPGAPVVRLELTGLFGNSAGFYGDITHNDGSSDYTGKWGGHFFGNGRSDGIPGSAAGTFGATNEDGSKSYLGAFGTHLNN